MKWKIEVRASLSKGRGSWPAIWLMPRESKYDQLDFSSTAKRRFFIRSYRMRVPANGHLTRNFILSWTRRPEEAGRAPSMTMTCGMQIAVDWIREQKDVPE